MQTKNSTLGILEFTKKLRHNYISTVMYPVFALIKKNWLHFQFYFLGAKNGNKVGSSPGPLHTWIHFFAQFL